MVFGTGAVGLSGMLAAIASGATTIIAVDIVDSRLEFAKTLGATHTINSKNEDAVASIKEITHGGRTSRSIRPGTRSSSSRC